MIRELLIKLIEEDDDLEIFQKEILIGLWKMADSWKEVNSLIMNMPLSEKNEIKIRKILNNIGDEMIEVCEILINESNKAS